MTTQQAVQRIAKMPPKKLTLAAAKKWIAMLEDELTAGDALRANTWGALTKAEERVAHLEMQLENEKIYSAHLRSRSEEHIAELDREVEHLTEKLGEGTKVIEGLLQEINAASRPRSLAARIRSVLFP